MAVPPSPDRGAGSPPAPDWPDLDSLPGVAPAVERARSAIATVRRLPANRRGWSLTAAAAGVRAARASAVLDGGRGRPVPEPDAGAGSVEAGPVTDPVLAGALRATAAIGELTAVWRRAPLQALARLHMLAAADLVPGADLGRPRAAVGAAQRLAMLAQVATRSPWSGPVATAVVHGELLALRPFGSADGVVARAAARLTMVATGLDPLALTVPEVGHLRAGAAYHDAATGFASGSPGGVADWIRHVCAALVTGADEAQSIAAAAGG